MGVVIVAAEPLLWPADAPAASATDAASAPADAPANGSATDRDAPAGRAPAGHAAAWHAAARHAAARHASAWHASTTVRPAATDAVQCASTAAAAGVHAATSARAPPAAAGHGGSAQRRAPNGPGRKLYPREGPRAGQGAHPGAPERDARAEPGHEQDERGRASVPLLQAARQRRQQQAGRARAHQVPNPLARGREQAPG